MLTSTVENSRKQMIPNTHSLESLQIQMHNLSIAKDSTEDV